MIILIDQDGPLADFEGHFLKLWRQKYPDAPYLIPEQRKSFYIHEDLPDQYHDFVREVQCAPDFILDLPPITGAKEAVHRLIKEGHSLFVCTAPLSQYRNCVPEKYLWLEKHFGFDFTKRVIMTKDKTLIHGDILIDDKPNITGLRTPDWQQILFDAPYNQGVNHLPRLASDWSNLNEIMSNLQRF